MCEMSQHVTNKLDSSNHSQPSALTYTAQTVSKCETAPDSVRMYLTAINVIKHILIYI